MPGLGILRREIGMPFAHDFHNPGDFRILAAVVEESQIPLLHVVAHKVAGLIIPHAVPTCGLAGRVFQIGKRIAVGFAFEKPMPHGSVLLKKMRIREYCSLNPHSLQAFCFPGNRPCTAPATANEY